MNTSKGSSAGARMRIACLWGVLLLAAVPVTLTAGAPRDFEVEMFARRCPGDFHSVDATGQITFEGTDPNAAVISCKQFGPKAVPVLPRTWGWLKTIYR